MLFFALVLHFPGLKIIKYENVRPEWLRWGLKNWTCWQGTLRWNAELTQKYVGTGM